MPRRVMKRFSRRFRAQKREHIWVSTFIIGDLQLMNGDGEGIAIVEPDDWTRTAVNLDVIEKGATLLRIVGDVAFRTDNGSGTTSLGGFTGLWGLAKYDQDDASVPTIGNEWFGEDWIHTRMVEIAPNNATTAAYAPQPNQRQEVDVRVKRKMTSDEVIRFWFAGFPANAVASATEFAVCDYYFRALVQLP